jgi:nicotinamide-nucleotide amidase
MSTRHSKVEDPVPDGSAFGFRAYPQLETKLTIRARIWMYAQNWPGRAEVRKRLGTLFWRKMKTLKGALDQLTRRRHPDGGREFTSGQIAARVAPLPGAEVVFRRGTLARSLAEIYQAVGLEDTPPTGAITPAMAETVATAARVQTGATHALVVLVDLDAGADRIDFGGTTVGPLPRRTGASRRSRIVGGRDCAPGAVEMGLIACAVFTGLIVQERIDFEKTDDTP